ncbi:hypothetical protein BDF20DRAFT_800596, partial [Mycotypha africana]|uniref:uncharacterized protein n=1 Tax=Mycotypha africana TaxID=64632 RepID=UPI0022FFCFFF
VDLRVLRDIPTRKRKRQEQGVSTAEAAAVGSGLGKKEADRTKLFLEAKTILNALESNTLAVPCLQIDGLTLRLYSLRLAGKGLYVGVAEGVATFPDVKYRLKDL